MSETNETVAPQHSYKLIKTLIDDEHEDGYSRRQSWLVKLPESVIARSYEGNNAYADVQYVIASTVRLRKTDSEGTFVYEESNVIASDEDADQHPAFLYFAKRNLSLEEIMFSIGVN